MSAVSGWLIPLLLAGAVVAATLKTGGAYEAFTDGARKGLETALRVAPYVAAMLTMVYALRASGLFDALETYLAPVMTRAGLDAKLTAFMLLRPLSGSGSLALLADLCDAYGSQSRTALTAAVMTGSTETLFYTFALYFGAAKVRRTRYAMACALFATLVGYAVSMGICNLMFH